MALKAMENDHSCFGEQATQATCPPGQIEPAPKPLATVSGNEGPNLAIRKGLMPLAARRQIWVGVMVLTLEFDHKQANDVAGPIDRRV